MSTKTLLITSVLFGFLLSVMIAGTANADMVAYYKFEGNANDSSGNNLHGIEKGNISYVAGVSDQAIDLDGKDSYMVDCGADAAFDIGNQSDCDDGVQGSGSLDRLYVKFTASRDGEEDVEEYDIYP